MLLCAAHFSESQFMNEQRKRLIWSAVPGITTNSEEWDKKKCDTLPSVTMECLKNQAYPVTSTLPENVAVSCSSNSSEANSEERDRKNCDPSSVVTLERLQNQANPIIEGIWPIKSPSPENVVVSSPSTPKGCKASDQRDMEDIDVRDNNEKHQNLTSMSKIIIKKFQIYIPKMDNSVQRISIDKDKLTKILEGRVSVTSQFKDANFNVCEKFDEYDLPKGKSASDKLLTMEYLYDTKNFERKCSDKLTLNMDQWTKLMKMLSTVGHPMKCIAYGKQFNNRSILLSDERTLFCEKPNENNASEKEEFSQNRVKCHEKIQAMEESYGCNECGMIFSQQSSFKKHQIRNHGPKRCYKCNVCGKTFSQNRYLKTHERIHTKPYECYVCGKKFSMQIKLTMHEGVHTKGKHHECNICGKKFIKHYYLRDHAMIHTGEKPYLCMICGKTFNKQCILQRHERTHFGVKLYECNVCGKKFSQNRRMKDHKRIHTGEKPFGCEECGKKFSTQDGLKYHKMVHTGEKPYKCIICGKNFSRNEHLKNHKMTHTGEKPYRCNECGKRYSNKSGLWKHTVVHTGEKKPYRYRKKCSQNDYLKCH